jgi:hypothetical protein
VTWLFFTRLTLVYTGFCTTATNNIHCVLDSVWRYLGWTANFNNVAEFFLASLSLFSTAGLGTTGKNDTPHDKR